MAAREDIDQFLEVFVQLKTGDELIPYSDEYYTYVSKHMKDYWYDSWVLFLKEKANRMGDDFYDWYDNMTFDSLDPRDLYSYRLPESQIILPYDNEEKCVLNIYNILSKWYEGCNVTEDDPIIMSVTFETAMIEAGYDFLTGFKDAARAQFIKDSFDDALIAVQTELEKYNEAQGDTGMHIELGAHPEAGRNVANRAFINDAGKLIKSTTSRQLAILWEDLFYKPNKKPASEDDRQKFFRAINVAWKKGMKDPGELGAKKYKEVIDEYNAAKKKKKELQTT